MYMKTFQYFVKRFQFVIFMKQSICFDFPLFARKVHFGFYSANQAVIAYMNNH